MPAFRFRVRTLLAMIVGCGLLLGAARWFGSSGKSMGLAFAASEVAGGIGFIAGLAWGKSRGRGVGEWGTLALLSATTFGMLATSYIAMARHRTEEGSFLFQKDIRGWPYPDRFLWSLNDWYDARHPAPPDSLKLHAEIPRVQLTLDSTMFLVASATGLGLGLLGRIRLPGPRGCEPLSAEPGPIREVPR